MLWEGIIFFFAYIFIIYFNDFFFFALFALLLMLCIFTSNKLYKLYKINAKHKLLFLMNFYFWSLCSLRPVRFLSNKIWPASHSDLCPSLVWEKCSYKKSMVYNHYENLSLFKKIVFVSTQINLRNGDRLKKNKNHVIQKESFWFPTEASNLCFEINTENIKRLKFIR